MEDIRARARHIRAMKRVQSGKWVLTQHSRGRDGMNNYITMPMTDAYREKINILMFCDDGTSIPGVGDRTTASVFWLEN